MTERKGREDETGVEVSWNLLFHTPCKLRLILNCTETTSSSGPRNDSGPSGQLFSICRGIYIPIVRVEGLAMNHSPWALSLSLWKKSCKTRHLCSIVLLPQEEKKMHFKCQEWRGRLGSEKRYGLGWYGSEHPYMQTNTTVTIWWGCVGKEASGINMVWYFSSLIYANKWEFVWIY